MLWHMDVPDVTKKLWGHETLVVNTPLYCGKILTVLNNGNASSVHFHKDKMETLHVTQGCLNLEIWMCKWFNTKNRQQKRHLILDHSMWRKTAALHITERMSVTLRPGEAHRFWNTGGENCIFYEFSTHDDINDSYRIVKSGPAPKFPKKTMSKDVFCMARDFENIGIFPIVKIPESALTQPEEIRNK